MTNVQKLHIRDFETLEHLLGDFSALQSLTSLDMHRMYSDVKELATIGSLRKLEHLTLRGRLWWPGDDEEDPEEPPWNGLTSFTSVRQLQLIGVYYTYNLLESFAGLTQLTYLSVAPDTRNASSPTESDIAHLSPLSSLQHLHMHVTYEVTVWV